jgi:hypothetical protein
LYSCHMFGHYIHLHQGQLTCPSLKAACCNAAINCRSYSSYCINCTRNNSEFAVFHSSRTMTLGSTRPLTEMSTRNIYCWVKAAGAYS